MTLNTNMQDTSDLTDDEIQTVLDLVGLHSHCPKHVRNMKVYILLTRSLKVSHPEMFKDPDVEAVRPILGNAPFWNGCSDKTVKDTMVFKAYMAGKAAR